MQSKRQDRVFCGSRDHEYPFLLIEKYRIWLAETKSLHAPVIPFSIGNNH